MSPLLRILLPLAVVLPLGAFVAGALASAGSDEPPPRAPIELTEDTTTPAVPTGDTTRRPDDGDDRDEGDDGDDEGDDDGSVAVITPSPYTGDDGDDEGRGDDAEDDHDDDGDNGGDDGDD